jgi:hypothetical protein
MGGISLGFCRFWAHFPQNMKSGGFEKLHFGQISSNLVAHFPQNSIPSGFSCWHFGHFIFCPHLNVMEKTDKKERNKI